MIILVLGGLVPFNSLIFAHSYSAFVSIIVFMRLFSNGIDIFRMCFSFWLLTSSARDRYCKKS